MHRYGEERPARLAAGARGGRLWLRVTNNRHIVTFHSSIDGHTWQNGQVPGAEAGAVCGRRRYGNLPQLPLPRAGLSAEPESPDLSGSKHVSAQQERCRYAGIGEGQGSHHQRHRATVGCIQENGFKNHQQLTAGAQGHARQGGSVDA
ncbi:hypothetical protein G6F50_015183 [Rhizopus delemar]|uniref:Uncharacterized protein n=1 Tax=Rhizopus delemar TaxID=936053 RepID=A0A9P7C5G0_9FUNG|nr:hypothetical protein G6F50_015183 [Rhizopus delemar]